MVKTTDDYRQHLTRCSIEQAPEGVFWAQANGLFYHANKQFCEQTGYADNELTALPVYRMVTDWGESRWPEVWRRLRDQQFMYFKARLTTRLGEVVPVEISAGLFKNDAGELMCGFVHDSLGNDGSAAALRAELEESVARFRLLYNNAPVMLQACDFETRLFSVNQYWLDALGYGWDEVIGRQTLEFMTEPTRKRVTESVIPILRQTGTIHDFEYQLVKKSGELIDVALTAVSDRDRNGQIIRTLSMLLPITDRKRAENLESQNLYLRAELIREFNSDEIIGTSAPMQEVFKNIDLVAATDATVLLLGETGTGKELVARAIHRRSDRGQSVMVKVDCGALPSGLVESELFGHEKGAFTGATARHKGRFELAHKSTIFLDEVGELPLDIQTRLLRVLQDQELVRVGSSETINVDVRVIAATNRNLITEVQKGRFRSDLFYRLNIFPMQIPPLRERREDIPFLAEYFTHRFAARFRKKIKGIHHKAIEKLISWQWPGNVRELTNLLERGVILCDGDTLYSEHIALTPDHPISHQEVIPTLAEGERRLILQALDRCDGRLSGPRGAAVLLGVKRRGDYS